MGRKLLKNKNWIYIVLSMAVLALVFVALHDMQTALGVGLYLSICAGDNDRTAYDIAVDVIMLVALVILMVIPCLAYKKVKAESFFRLLLVSLAFMPQLSPAYLVHFFKNDDLFLIRQAFTEGKIISGLLEGLEYSASLLQMVIPMFCLLLMALGIKRQMNIKRSYFIILVIGLLMEIGALIFLQMAELLCFGMTYCILLIMFDMWESLIIEHTGMKNWGWILFVGLGLRGVYRLLEMMSGFHI